MIVLLIMTSPAMGQLIESLYQKGAKTSTWAEYECTSLRKVTPTFQERKDVENNC